MAHGQINSPTAGIQQCFISFKNDTGAAVAHGDVIVKDLAAIKALVDAGSAVQEIGTTATTAASNLILGVVFDPQGNGVANGDVGLLMVRGYHSAVKCTAAAITAYATMVHSTVAGTVEASTAGETLAGAVIGHAATHKANTTGTTIEMFVDVK